MGSIKNSLFPFLFSSVFSVYCKDTRRKRLAYKSGSRSKSGKQLT